MNIKKELSDLGYVDKFPAGFYFSLKGLVAYYWLTKHDVKFIGTTSITQPSQGQIKAIVDIIKKGFSEKKIIVYNNDLVAILPNDWGDDFVFSASNIIKFFKEEYSEELPDPADPYAPRDAFFFLSFIDLDFEVNPQGSRSTEKLVIKGFVRANHRTKCSNFVDDVLEHYFKHEEVLPNSHLDLIRHASIESVNGYDDFEHKDRKIFWHDGETSQSCQIRQIKKSFKTARERNKF